MNLNSRSGFIEMAGGTRRYPPLRLDCYSASAGGVADACVLRFRSISPLYAQSLVGVLAATDLQTRGSCHSKESRDTDEEGEDDWDGYRKPPGSPNVDPGFATIVDISRFINMTGFFADRTCRFLCLHSGRYDGGNQEHYSQNSHEKENFHFFLLNSDSNVSPRSERGFTGTRRLIQTPRMNRRPSCRRRTHLSLTRSCPVPRS